MPTGTENARFIIGSQIASFYNVDYLMKSIFRMHNCGMCFKVPFGMLDSSHSLIMSRRNWQLLRPTHSLVTLFPKCFIPLHYQTLIRHVKSDTPYSLVWCNKWTEQLRKTVWEKPKICMILLSDGPETDPLHLTWLVSDWIASTDYKQLRTNFWQWRILIWLCETQELRERIRSLILF